MKNKSFVVYLCVLLLVIGFVCFLASEIASRTIPIPKTADSEKLFAYLDEMKTLADVEAFGFCLLFVGSIISTMLHLIGRDPEPPQGAQIGNAHS